MAVTRGTWKEALGTLPSMLPGAQACQLVFVTEQEMEAQGLSGLAGRGGPAWQ